MITTLKQFAFPFIATCTLMALCPLAIAVSPQSEMERVNIIAETGINVGPCPGKGNLVYPSKPYKGVPFFLPRTDAKIKAAHDLLTSGEAKWIHDLDGPAPNNRMYLDGAGHRILVFSVCLEHQCDSNSLFGTFNLANGEYGLQISEQGKKRTLGSISDTSLAGIACAESIDDHLRSEAAATIKNKFNK
jgi:hypothetical protein